jgi:hypothetical protein
MPRTFAAVNTNVLFDLAAGLEAVLEALEAIRQRIPGIRLIVPPSVLHEVALIAIRGDTFQVCGAHSRGGEAIAKPLR